MPDRRSAELIHTREVVQPPTYRTDFWVRHRSAVGAAGRQRKCGFRTAITPFSAAAHSGPALPI